VVNFCTAKQIHTNGERGRSVSLFSAWHMCMRRPPGENFDGSLYAIWPVL